MSDSVRPHRRQPTRVPHPWDSPGKNTGVGCHFLLQCMKVKSESEVAQSCPTLSDAMDCSLPGSSVHGIFQTRVLEWGAIAFSIYIYIHTHIYIYPFPLEPPSHPPSYPTPLGLHREPAWAPSITQHLTTSYLFYISQKQNNETKISCTESKNRISKQGRMEFKQKS